LNGKSLPRSYAEFYVQSGSWPRNAVPYKNRFPLGPAEGKKNSLSGNMMRLSEIVVHRSEGIFLWGHIRDTSFRGHTDAKL
jgi:hypothetical protein